MLDINFLSRRQFTLSKVEEADGVWMKYGIIAFSASMVVFILFLSTSLYLSSKLTSVKRQQEQVKQAILAEKELETSYVIFSNKLQLIREIFEQRSDKQEAITFLTELFGPSAFLGGLDYDQKTGTLAVRTTSEHVFALKDTFDKLSDTAVTDHFATVSKSRLGRNELGQYDLTITVALKKGGLTSVNSTEVTPVTEPATEVETQ